MNILEKLIFVCLNKQDNNVVSVHFLPSNNNWDSAVFRVEFLTESGMDFSTNLSLSKILLAIEHDECTVDMIHNLYAVRLAVNNGYEAASEELDKVPVSSQHMQAEEFISYIDKLAARML